MAPTSLIDPLFLKEIINLRILARSFQPVLCSQNFSSTGKKNLNNTAPPPSSEKNENLFNRNQDLTGRWQRVRSKQLATDWNVFHVLSWRREVPEGIRWVNSAWILTCSITRINFNTNPTVMKVSFVLN